MSNFFIDCVAKVRIHLLFIQHLQPGSGVVYYLGCAHAPVRYKPVSLHLLNEFMDLSEELLISNVQGI